MSIIINQVTVAFYGSTVQDHVYDLYLNLKFFTSATYLLNAMAVRHRILWLIHILYYVGSYKHFLLTLFSVDLIIL